MNVIVALKESLPDSRNFSAPNPGIAFLRVFIPKHTPMQFQFQDWIGIGWSCQCQFNFTLCFILSRFLNGWDLSAVQFEFVTFGFKGFCPIVGRYCILSLV